MTAPTPQDSPRHPGRGGKAPMARPSVISLLQTAKVTSLTRELDLSYAYDVTPKVLEILFDCMPQLRRLVIKEVGLVALPDNLGQLAHLRELDVSHNALTALPPSIGALSELQHLNISRNQVAHLPNTLTPMVNLRLVNANYNQLTSLPPTLGDLGALRVLRVGANQLRELPAFIAYLYDMRLIQLAYNQLTALPQALVGLGDLKVIDISFNKIATWPDKQRLPTNLSTLNLLGNPLSHVPQSLLSAHSHELKIIGLPRPGGTEVLPARAVAVPVSSGASSTDDTPSGLNATQDITGLLYAGLDGLREPPAAGTQPQGHMPQPELAEGLDESMDLAGGEAGLKTRVIGESH